MKSTRAVRLAAVAALCVLTIGRLTGAPAAAADNAAIDRVFSAWDRRDSPGCALAVFNDGKIVYERGYGMADLEHEIPIGPDTVFYVGSVSKQFTAFAAALAIQQGRLALDDSIRKRLPELPEYAQPITIRHLIHHTSGLRDFYTLLSIAGRRQDELFDNAAVLRLAARQDHLNFPPGSDYLYSNTGYALLATTIGRAAGTSFAAFVDANIFKPLGMTASHVHDDDARLVKGRAYGYSRLTGGEVRLDTPAGERVGAGGVFTTVRDLQRWDENFYDARVGGRALIDQIQMPGSLNDGKPLTYAWGLEIGTYRGERVVEHGGSLGGYRAHLIRFPARHLSVACLCNLAGIAPATLARQVADVMLGGSFPAPKTSAAAPIREGREAANRTSSTPPPLTPTALAEYVGDYYSTELDATFTITTNDGRLFFHRDADDQPTAAQIAGPDQFRFRAMTVRFARGTTGSIDALIVDAGRVRDIRFRRRGPR
jgi:CubicO group peptidase (beta-lactamase class C family)